MKIGANSLPGGSAAGAAVQFHMLTTAGFDTDTAVGGLTAFSLLGVGGLLALPLFALPTILVGAPISRGLVHTTLLGIAGFVLYAIFGIIVLRTDWPLATLGRAAQSVWNRITRGHRQPVAGLDKRLLSERDTIRAVLGKNWRQAVVLTVGRLGFDYRCLLAALRATGAEPRPSLVLLACSAVGIIGLLPVTPGGLGIVEASLSGLLILAGVHVGYAILATLAYRIASYWLPSSPGCRPTCSSITATDGPFPGSPRRPRTATRDRRRVQRRGWAARITTARSANNIDPERSGCAVGHVSRPGA